MKKKLTMGNAVDITCPESYACPCNECPNSIEYANTKLITLIFDEIRSDILIKLTKRTMDFHA